MPDTFNIARSRPLLQKAEFSKLFIEELGWDISRQKLTLDVGGEDFELHAIAQKRSFTAWSCECPNGKFPDHATRLKIDRKLAETSFEHLIVFVTADRSRQSWMWVRWEKGQPIVARTHEYHRSYPGDALLHKLESLYVSLEEEERGDLSTVGIAGRVRTAFDVERVTKNFYRDFDAQRKAFLNFIKGIGDVGDREWYASVMLNRLMFVYFIQRKGFLDGDRNYLRNRLDACKREKGKDQFHAFYGFLINCLFREGFGKRRKDRAKDLEKLIGNIPYLNGGLFDVHELEKPERYGKEIQIPDKAFEAIFDFFEKWDWQLDPARTVKKAGDKEQINPDILGFIFERYINDQAKMGAYYTKEDITDYIAKNAIIPYLFDAAKKKCAVAFEGNSFVWDLLRFNPDRYIYPAVRHGMDLKLPKEIAVGLDPKKPSLIERRKAWNKTAPPEFGLPTEIWRETVARRQRCEELRAKLAAGEVRDINDLITLNLDIRQFAQDVITRCEGPDLLRAIWSVLTNISVLDPTCGSGAFLFAALNILESLYEACLDRMAAFLEDEAARHDRTKLKTTQHGHPLLPNRKFEDFSLLLEQVANHPNRSYFVFKRIILKNLYGVDLMKEAVEICKLRLFLKLASQIEPDETKDNLGIEPLPDIDFNIRGGNTLVGYATKGELEAVGNSDLILKGQVKVVIEAAEDAAKLYDCFLKCQVEGDHHATEFKRKLRDKFDHARKNCDLFIAESYRMGVTKKPKDFEDWIRNHQPFHWFIEFYGILTSGGFDVVIGNPPYVSSSNVDYLSKEMRELKLPDIYALVLLRSLALSSKNGRCGMIVPLSLTFSSEFGILRTALCAAGSAWFSSYDNIPASIFEGVSQRCTIWLGSNGSKRCFSTPMYRWRAAFRKHLMSLVSYVQTDFAKVATEGLPKLYSKECSKVLSSIHCPIGKPQRRVMASGKTRGNYLRFSPSARNFISVFREPPPCLSATSLKNGVSSGIGEISCSSDTELSVAFASLAGELFLLYWLIRGDGFHLTSWNVKDFLRCLDYLPQREFSLLSALGQLLHERRFEGLVFKKNAGKYVGNFNFQCHFSITRRADLLVLAGLGLGREEALDVFDRVQRVLAINEAAGEKGIPDVVKSKYLPEAINVTKQKKLFHEIDTVLAQHYGFTPEELDFIINYDIKYRLGRGAGDEDE